MAVFAWYVANCVCTLRYLYVEKRKQEPLYRNRRRLHNAGCTLGPCRGHHAFKTPVAKHFCISPWNIAFGANMHLIYVHGRCTTLVEEPQRQSDTTQEEVFGKRICCCYIDDYDYIDMWLLWSQHQPSTRMEVDWFAKYLRLVPAPTTRELQSRMHSVHWFSHHINEGNQLEHCFYLFLVGREHDTRYAM